MASLGCGLNRAYITSKCNGSRVCDLDADTIYYDRRLDDISEAQVEVTRTGRKDDCCHCVSDIWPLCHELVIHRDGIIVWQGPVTEVVEQSEKVIIRAKDKLVWMTLRVLVAPLTFLNTTSSGINLTDIAERLLFSASNLDEAGCFASPSANHAFPHKDVQDSRRGIINLGDGRPDSFNRDRVFTAYDGTIFDQFQSLAESGVDYSVVRGCLILGGEPSNTLPPIATLSDQHLLGTVEIVKSYNDYGNTFYVDYDGDDDAAKCKAQGAVINGATIVPCPVVAFTDDKQCFGLVERHLSKVQGVGSAQAALDLGALYVTQNADPPLRIDFPPGTQLAPDTPWDINDMIPGQQVRVALSDYCTAVDQQFILQKVTVNDGEQGEKIAIDLGPISKLGSP